MRRIFWFLLPAVWLAALAAQASPSSPDLIARIHFAGAGQISADTNAAAFTNLWGSPEAQAVRDQTLNKLSRAPYSWFKEKMPAGAGDGAAQLRPLLDDLSDSEWFLQVREATNGSPESALAIHLDAARAKLWQANLAGVLEAWTGMSVEKIPNGWQLKKHLPPNLIRFARMGDWVVIGCGEDRLPLNDELMRHVQAEKRPAPVEPNAWLAADLDWPRLARWYPLLKPAGLPEIRLQVAGHNGKLQSQARLIFPQPLGLTLEKWSVPADLIHPPFISFTAVRGIAPWLEKQDWARPYAISPVPNQLYVWALPQMPLQTFAAVPVPDAKKVLLEFKQKLSAETSWQSHFQMPVTMVATNDRISWQGIPFVSPNLSATHEPAGDFLFAGVFPNSPRTKQPLPPELLAQLDRTNLVYFDWEITGERLGRLPQLTQLALMETRHKQLPAQSVAGKWLTRIGPPLGIAVTEVTRTAPDELSFKRSAPGGFTAIEFIALANWLEATNFPGCDLSSPLRPNLKHPHSQIPGPPPAFQLH